MTNDKPTIDKIYFLVRDPARAQQSYTWRIWPGGTSFYVKSTYAEFSNMKISLHGPDPKHPGPVLKFGHDSNAPPTRSGFVGLSTLPVSFRGKTSKVERDVRHVMRFRHDWTMFHPDVPPAPTPKPLKKPDTTQAGVCPPPAQMWAVDIDLFLCEHAPAWPNEKQAREDNATLGPIQNSAGQFLTGVVSHNPALETTPECVTAPKPAKGDRILRGLGIGVHREILWINEVKLGHDQLLAAQHEDRSAMIESRRVV